MTVGLISLLALTLLGRGLIAGLGLELDMDFSLRQSRAEHAPAHAQPAAAGSLAPAARCE